MENKKENNPNAFPTMEHGYDNYGQPIVNTYEGMTLRDYFDNSAMQGILSNESEIQRLISKSPNVNKLIAEISYNIADAMLEQRELI